MVVTTFTTSGTASTVLALSKATWRLAISLSKLDQNTKSVNSTIEELAGEVKSLGIECDLVYAKLDEVVSKNETGSPWPNDVDGRLWNCLATQVEETSRTVQELELFVNTARREGSRFNGQAQRLRELDKNRDQVASIRTKVSRHTDNLRTTLLLINTILTHPAPCGTEQQSNELKKLNDIVKELQKSSEADPQSRLSHTEATLVQCAREAILKGTTIYEASLAAVSGARGQGVAYSNTHVGEWMNSLEFIRRERRRLDSSGIATNTTSTFDASDSDDDLETELAKAALDTGTKAFEAREWGEADSLLQEALWLLQQLPEQQRGSCDIFSLHYKLAICAYHTREPGDAEKALMSLVEQPANSDEQRGCIYDATHLLSQLHVLMGQFDRARSECEKALQARRRLLGKRSDASLESTALMAHIYVLLNNRALAKSCLAMIPEGRRNAVLKIVEVSLGTKVEHLDFASLMTRSNSGDSDLTVKRVGNGLSASPLGLTMETCCYSPVSAIVRSPTPSQSSTMKSPTPSHSSMVTSASIASFRQPSQRISSAETCVEDLQSAGATALSSGGAISELKATERKNLDEEHCTDSAAHNPAALSRGEPPGVHGTSKGKTLSRKEILDKIGCQPRDRIEEAVCDGDCSALANLLQKKKGFWRSGLRKRVRPERVTALHFATLFGEIDMAQRLLSANFYINEVPFGYTTSLTPLNFAIGARQVNMVGFLIANGARPAEPDSWSTLAGQLLSRSWLMKTMSEAEKEYVPNQITAILGILLRHGWDVNAPFEPTTGRTVLHQAVTFWTGSYRWDLNLRAVVTSFLCKRGADPLQADREGKTPYDMASASGHQDLVLILGRDSRRSGLGNMSPEPVELPVQA